MEENSVYDTLKHNNNKLRGNKIPVRVKQAHALLLFLKLHIKGFKNVIYYIL